MWKVNMGMRTKYKEAQMFKGIKKHPKMFQPNAMEFVK